MSEHMPQQGQFCWNELMTGNTTAAKRFYGDLFGWKTEEHNVDDKVYNMFQSVMAGMMEIPQGQEREIPPHWLSYVYVNDVDAMVSKAKTLGAQIKVPVTQVNDYGRFAIIIDPTGAHLGLWQSLKSCC
jgi:predicted enzyme related to lactoylglutathione lyase